MVTNTLFWKNKKVLITGHTGFKESLLTLWLLSMGAEVWGYALEPNESQTLFTNLFLDGASHSLMMKNVLTILTKPLKL